MNIIIVDDDKIVESSLKTILEASGEVKVMATGSNGQEAVELYKTHRPDIALMDIRMPIMTGLEAAEEILAHDANAKVLFLTTFADDEYIVKALNMGAKGYILKQDFESIAPALKAVLAGQSVFGRDIVSKLTSKAKSAREDYRTMGITEKEEEVIELVAKGLNNKEIGGSLFLSEGTVRNYISTILEKLDLRDRTQLAIFHLAN
ncbi:MAG: response regulator transcription factor [Defluviitaleaceae bacterium]|nr:response regulator transcription factor [Defluviitaleaceae bacterium]